MNIRPYTTDDGKHLGDMLLAEGLKPEDMCFSSNTTYVCSGDTNIEGFFTYYMDKDLPHLIHFCVDREYRNFDAALELTKNFKDIVSKYKKAIIHVHDDDAYLNKFVKWYFKSKPYTYQKPYNFYLVEVDK